MKKQDKFEKFFTDLRHCIYINFCRSYNLDYRSPLVELEASDDSYKVVLCLPFVKEGISIRLHYSYSRDALKELINIDAMGAVDATADLVTKDLIKQINKGDE